MSVADVCMALRLAAKEPPLKRVVLGHDLNLAAALLEAQAFVIEAARNLEPLRDVEWHGKWRIHKVLDALLALSEKCDE